MLEALELEAVRGDSTLFSGLGFALAPGALLRVTGANGSGKTSLLRILYPTRGQSTFFLHTRSQAAAKTVI